MITLRAAMMNFWQAQPQHQSGVAVVFYFAKFRQVSGADLTSHGSTDSS